MTPPPIRYPLPALVLAIALGLLVWRGAEWTRPARLAIHERWARLVEGPPPPASTTPQFVAGPIVRRVLLLRDGVPWSDRPGGSATGTIRLRQFADVYDIWPAKGEPTHYRIGNRQPIGWVAAGDVLPWSTRLVTRIGASWRPVLNWDEAKVEVAEWVPGRDWHAVASRSAIPFDRLPAGSWGVLLDQDEVRRLIDSPSVESARLRAVLGRLVDDRPLDLDAARASLPRPVAASRSSWSAESLLNRYEHWRPDAAWSGLSFQVVPLEEQH